MLKAASLVLIASALSSWQSPEDSSQKVGHAADYSLVIGQLIAGSNTAGAEDCTVVVFDGCWNSVNSAKMKVSRTLGGKKISSKIDVVYVSHAFIRDGSTMLFFLKQQYNEPDFFIQEFSGRKNRGELCLEKAQMEDILKTEIKITKPVKLCPSE